MYNANKGIIGLGDKQYLATNDATSASSGYNGTQSYVARYDKSSGTLYLKGYQGVGAEGGIVAVGDLNIKVEGDSSFTTSRTSTDDLMGIQASGKLNISGPGKLTLSATAPGSAYGIFAKEGIEISAPLDVTVKLNDSTKNRLLYGIYTNSGAISLSGGAKTITVTGGTGPVNGVYNAAKTPAITGNGNIDIRNISGKLTVDLINGSSNVGICTDGGTITLNAAEVNIPSNHYYGIYNENGDVIIQNNSNVTLTSAIESGEGIYANYGGDLIIKNSTVKVSAHGYAANPEKGKLSIENSEVELTKTSDRTALVVNTLNSATNTIDLSGSGTVADVTGVSGEYTLPANGFTAPSGKQFKAWSVGGSEKAAGDKITVTANTTVTAVWENTPVVTYTVSFDANGGTGTMTDVTGVSGEYTLPANGFTAPAGKQFKAWSVGGSEKAVGDKITVTANTTVTAVWENTPVVTYTVSFDANGGTGAMTDVTGVSGEYTLPANGFTAPAGKQFKAWSVGGVEKAAGDKITVTANTTVTAVWENTPVVTYTVSFDANGGTGTMTDVTGVSGEYTLPANGFTAPAGKQFKAWSVGGVEKAAGDKITVTANTTVTAIWEPIPATEYTITFNVNGGIGTIPSQTTSGQKLSSLPTATHSGSYSFVGWYTAASGGTQITTAYTFSADTTVYAHWTYIGGGGGGGGSYTPSYTVSVDKTENGTITVSPKSASKGDAVTITVKPDKGYELDTLKVLDKNGDKVKLAEKNGKYTFKMPSGKVTVKGSFVEEAPVQIFKDVPADAYYYEAVKWAAEKGITGGVGNGLFAPNQPCTRAQIVTFLWRAAGSPSPKHMSSFADVPADAFYAKAVAWAVENGITGGTGDGKFSPDATCTRAQSVTFLYRASGSPAVIGSATFSDVAANAYYAEAVKWAAEKGITGGIGGGLFGSDNDCTRAQIVTFLYRSVK